MSHIRRVPLEHLYNCRDLGGYACEVPEGIERISYPLQKEEAPKQEKEAEKTLEEVLAENEKKEAMGAFEKSLSDGYVKTMEECPEKVAGVLNLIAEKLEKGAVLFHCTMGKDRTGVTAALIFLICGVSESDIVSDYQISAVCMEKNPGNYDGRIKD